MPNDDPENPRHGGGHEPEHPSPLSGPIASHAQHPHRRHAPPLYGVIAEFDTPGDLVHAARKVYEQGYRRINGYSPYPIEELSEAIGFTHTSLPRSEEHTSELQSRLHLVCRLLLEKK